MDSAYERFREAVQNLWPSYRCTDESLGLIWKYKLSRYDEATIGNALRHQRIDDPDATRPHWKSIYRYLGDLGHRDARSPLAILLTQVREAAKDLGNKHVDEWTDADAWHHYLYAQIHTYYLPFKARSDPEKAKAWRKETCESQYRFWRDELAGGGWDIPSYLSEETVPLAEVGSAVELKADPQLKL